MQRLLLSLIFRGVNMVIRQVEESRSRKKILRVLVNSVLLAMGFSSMYGSCRYRCFL